jgi:hypothetical protein
MSHLFGLVGDDDEQAARQKNFGYPELRYIGNNRAVSAPSGLVAALSQVPQADARSD